MKTLKQQIERNKEEFNEKFDWFFLNQTNESLKNTTTANNIKDWHTSSLSSLIKLLIQEEEKSKYTTYPNNNVENNKEKEIRLNYYNQAKQDTIFHLKELLKEIEK